MTWLGYRPEIRQVRRKAYKELGRLQTAMARGPETFMIEGSKAEGLTSFLESDIDSLHVLNDVIC
ncbi:hypothetical protein DPMN_038842 [Dreissena polymorpha]|uniref:Uncharacterized protein n=1 Tax=Dreissena polymorpha TaxID=45954 RepID=A0A9D4MFF0_DREPO|nr:hypothetical protein DPMN_038842 [Dreissena polymorpha]